MSKEDPEMKVIKGNTYKERYNNQLEEWARGNPIHNNIDNECCPDFSCCELDLLQPDEIRKTFKEVFNKEHHPYDDAKMGMLMSFLGGMIGTVSDKKVHIAGGEKIGLS